MDVTRWRRPAVVDGALVLVCLGLTLAAVKGHWSPLPRPAIAVAGAVGSLAQYWRRSLPQVAAVAGAVAYVLSGNPGPLAVGLYSGATYGPRRQVWLLALVGWAGLAGLPVLQEGRPSLNDIGFDLIAVALIVAVGLNAAGRRALLASWQERAEQSESQRRLHQEQARSAERTRIAREMHDVVAHKVSLIALHAGALELTAHKGPEQVGREAALIRLTAREALAELRSVLGVLQADAGQHRPDADLDPFADVASLVAASVRAGQRVDLRDTAGPLPLATARVVYRVAQEGLTNARKYAPDAPSTVSIERADDATVSVTVQNGPTDSPPLDLPGSGAGLVGLAERARLVGGSVHSGRTKDGGWRLRAVIPAGADGASTPESPASGYAESGNPR